MSDFPSRLAERIETSPLFRAALTELQQQSLAPLMGDAPKLTPFQTEKLSQAAVALARSSEPKHLGLAQEIAYSLAACEADSSLRSVWRHVLAEIGNFPAGDYVSGNSLANENLPWILRLREAARRRENTVSVLGQEIVFTDFQADVWRRLHGHQFVNVSAPTSAGKSFLVQTFLLDELATSDDTKNIVYVVPSRSLIYEVQASLTQALKPLSSRVVVTSTPQINEELHADKSRVFVVTQERWQTILNESDVAFDVVIIDEAQQIGDADRGVLLVGCLENALARYAATKMLFITPSSKDARTIAPLLGTTELQTIRSAIRPVRQNLLFVSGAGSGSKKHLSIELYRPEQKPLPLGEVVTTRSISKAKRLTTAALELGRDGQSIVYAWRPSAADSTAFELAAALPDTENYKGSPLEELANFVAKHIHPDFALAKVLKHGIGVHYGRLPTTISKAVEEYFDDGHIKYLVCTSTLLQGVNLPARNIFLKNPRKGSAGPLAADEFWNLAGRAGRLKRDTHGNVFLVDYEDWERKPVEDRQTTDVEPSICEALGAKQEALLAFALDHEHPSGNDKLALAESVFSRLLIDSRDGVIDQTISRALTRHPDVDTTALKEAILAAQDKVSLPTSLLRRNSLVSPLRQQKLYEHFKRQLAEGFLNSLIPVHPWQQYPDPRLRLEGVFRAIHTHLEGRQTKEEEFFGWFALAWMRGETLRKLIDRQVDRERAIRKLEEADAKLVGSVARKVMEQVETKLRYHYVKFLRCYLDILRFALEEEGLQDDLEMPPIPLFLELGASAKTMVSAMELGMSRIAAMEISTLLPREKDAMFIRSELKAPSFRRGALSSFVLREIERLGLLR
ncbi:DEAD/DEAH box helicase [Ralstonia pseudosolanacearum]|uniref:DEAD/DEAH box helicase n=1 Tax=Ralstonia pseudosolanacearum TaxID=1310165 RepID=UPI003AAA36C1